MTKTERKVYYKKYYQKHKEKFKRYQSSYRKTHREEIRQLQREDYSDDIKKRATKLWHRAKSRNKPNFQITKLWVERKLLKTRCEVTGIGFDYTKPKPHYNANPFAPSLDRIDCSKGYTYKNTQVVIWGYNVAKSFLDPADFEKLIRAIGEKFYNGKHNCLCGCNR